jgi:hypothetical protein
VQKGNLHKLITPPTHPQEKNASRQSG